MPHGAGWTAISDSQKFNFDLIIQLSLRMDINRDAPVIASAETFVDAPRSVVWAVQTELSSWPEWNPNVSALKLDGPLQPGTKFHWKSSGTKIVSTIQEVEPERQIVWTGRAPLGIQAVHTWSFESEDGGTRVQTEESFEGMVAKIFAGPMRRMLNGALQQGLMALKNEAERRVEEAA